MYLSLLVMDNCSMKRKNSNVRIQSNRKTAAAGQMIIFVCNVVNCPADGSGVH